MKNIDMKRLHTLRGTWDSHDTLNVWNVQRSEVYRSEEEPSFVCWAILWKENDGALKLSFTEVIGDRTMWPPEYNFNRPGVEYFLRTFRSTDEGKSWVDTGWKERLDENWDYNADHHIRHVFQMPEGQLVRNYGHTVAGVTSEMYATEYDPDKWWDEFPFNEKSGHRQGHKKTSTIWQSRNRGETWEQLYMFPFEEHYFISGIHALKNGSIVAVGAINPEHVNAHDVNWLSITESWDGGRTWSKPQKLLNNDDFLVSQGMCEEFDFVELDNGKLLMVMRTDGISMHMLQSYVERDESGTWRASEPTTNAVFRHSGYPCLCRASDGTIFFYSLQDTLYSCDDGLTWNELHMGNSYYGQIREAAPGKMIAVTQRNIGDASFPYIHDTFMLQTTFEYERTTMIEQKDARLTGSVAEIAGDTYADFHLFAEVRADGESGIAFRIEGDSYYFAAVVVPCNNYRNPGAAVGEQNAYLMIGKSVNGAFSVMRRMMIDRLVPGSWVGMQLDMNGDVLKAAVKNSPQSPAKYAVVKEDFGASGKLGMFTNKSSGAFKNMKVSAVATDIRSNWGVYADQSYEGRRMKEKEY